VTLDYLQDQGKYIFSNASAFSITIQSEEFDKIVGLSNATTHTAVLATSLDPNYAGQYIIRSTTLVDLSLNDYVFLDIDELRTPHNVDARKLDGASGTVSGSNANRSFAPILMDVASACIKNFHENKDYRISVEYPEPINVLQRLTVRWFDRDGKLLDFRGWDTNAFVLRIHVKPEPERVKQVFTEQIAVASEIQKIKLLAPEEQSAHAYRVANKMVCQSCSFLDICRTELSGGNSKLMIQTEYKIRERKQIAVSAEQES
jgi:hypothetical protein